MQIRRNVIPIVVLLALAVGYLAGMVRQGAQEGAAAAGPTAVNGGSPYLSYTNSEDGRSLVVWRLTNGMPESASVYRLDSSSAAGDYMGVVHFTPLPATKVK